MVVSGVSGCGKSTIGAALAERLGWDFADGDDFHSAAHIAKMRSGQPLTDNDREPWLGRIATWISERIQKGTPAVVACSALRKSHRDQLRRGVGNARGVWFVSLVLPPEVVQERVQARVDHFMPASLVADQFATFEPLSSDEQGWAVNGAAAVREVLAEIETQLNQRASAHDAGVVAWQPVFFYDPDCGFCTAVARRIAPWFPKVRFVPLSVRAAEVFGVDLGRARREAPMHTGAGRVVYGADALGELVRLAPAPWSCVSVVLDLPGVAQLLTVAYRVVARHRHQLPGGTAACKLPPQ